MAAAKMSALTQIPDDLMSTQKPRNITLFVVIYVVASVIIMSVAGVYLNNTCSFSTVKNQLTQDPQHENRPPKYSQIGGNKFQNWWTEFSCDIRGTDFALVWFTFVLIGVGYAQGVQLERTVETAAVQSKDMRDSIQESARAANAMEAVATSIEKSVAVSREWIQISRDHGRRQMRAYLTVVVGGAVYQERSRQLRFAGHPLVVNTGFSPANSVKFKAKAAILPVKNIDDFNFSLEDAVWRGGGTIGHTQNKELPIVLPDFLPDGDVESVKAGSDRALVVWGIVVYSDVFGEVWYTNFGQILVWGADNTVRGVYTTKHNDADDPQQLAIVRASS